MIAADPDNKQYIQVGTESEFALALKRVFREQRPRRILETGTHLGTGTTRIIGQAIREAGLATVEFISIEVNPQFVREARENVAATGVVVDIRHGLSVPRGLLPTAAQIHQDYVLQADPAVFVDHDEAARVQRYSAETDFPNVEDDLIGKVMRAWKGKVDFVLLDSAGHMGRIEFDYLLNLLRGPCLLMLDDTRHVKHNRSVERMKADPRFVIELDSPEKFGFVLASFHPKRTGLGWRLRRLFGAG